jgi:hypothetical protein
MKAASPQSAAIAKLPATSSGFSATQAAWRFFGNERVSLHDMMVPIRDAGRLASQERDSRFVLAVHDWSKIRCGSHHSKKDLARLTHADDIGYELYTCLMVDGDSGVPMAPMELRLETATEIHHTQDPELVEEVWHTDQIASVMKSARSWDVNQRVVHVADQEADSIGHYRDWAEMGELFLIRSEDRTVLWRDQERRFSSIVRTLLREDAFVTKTSISFRGRQHDLRVAETNVILHRPAQPRIDGKQRSVSGPPLPLRLVISRVYDERNRKKAEWFLVTNAPVEVDANQVAQWYYWRWRVETFFKLLKSSGFEIEHWRQATGEAFAKRLLAAAMACVIVWQLERNQSDDATEIKTILVKLSGRQMKRTRPFTAPAMLAGLEKLLAMLEILDIYTVKELKTLARKILPDQLINSS